MAPPHPHKATPHKASPHETTPPASQNAAAAAAATAAAAAAVAATHDDASRATIGLIAGNGRFPLLFARAAKARGLRVVAVAMHGETLPAVESEVDAITWVRVGQLRRMIRAFTSAGITRAAMAGGVRKTRLFSGMRPDWLAVRLLARAAIRRDDGMLRAVAQQFEAHGIEIVDSTLYMPEALAPAGVLTARTPNARQWQDLAYGLSIARDIGRLDIGQTVVVKDGAVVALEAIEGTDACIERAGALAQGTVVVKVAKPAQDMRFDLPTVGPTTIECLRNAGIRVLGIEAGRTLMLEPQRVVEAADAAGIIVVGLDGRTAQTTPTPARPARPARKTRKTRKTNETPTGGGWSR